MITRDEMQELEKAAGSKGITKSMLMHNAGKQTAKIIAEKFDLKGKRILVVSYHGNNGGDGFVVANHLAEKAEVEVLFVGDEAKLSSQAEENFRLLESNPMVQFISLDYVDFNDYDFIIDAVLGTGIKGELKHPVGTVIDLINASPAYKISIDIPSGIDPDSGMIYDKAVNADMIIALHDSKSGLQDFMDKTVVVDIGLR